MHVLIAFDNSEVFQSYDAGGLRYLWNTLYKVNPRKRYFMYELPIISQYYRFQITVGPTNSFDKLINKLSKYSFQIVYLIIK